MKKVVFLFYCFSFLLLKGQEFSATNYFYNLGYYSPADKNMNSFQFDLNTTSLFSRLPVGVNSHQLFLSGNFNNSFQASGFIQRSNFGKNQSFVRLDASFAYDLKLNGKSVTMGAGLKSFTSRYDETQLTIDFNEVDRSTIFGTDLFTENSLLIPLSASYNLEKLRIGAYYGVGLGRSATYGLYGKALLFKGELREAQVRNTASLGFYKELVNPKISLENKIEVENFGLSLFLTQNFNSSAQKNNSSLGLGVFYLWKLFNLSYQLNTNSNALGLSYQLGVQVYLPK